MPTVLALDAATTACSVALLHEGQMLSTLDATPQSHTRTLLPMLDSLLKEAEVELANVDIISFTHGPGSFTGIRIGFGAIQGLALGAGKPVLPVSTLQLLALTAFQKCELPGNALILPALDARMDEIYGAAFSCSDRGNLTTVREDFIGRPENAFKTLSEFDYALAVGDGWKYAGDIPCQPSATKVDLLPEARYLLQLAERAFIAGRAQSIDAVKPLYLRDRVSWKKRERLRKRQQPPEHENLGQ